MQADGVKPISGRFRQVVVHVDAGHVVISESGGQQRASISGPGAYVQDVHAVVDTRMLGHLDNQAGQCR